MVKAFVSQQEIRCKASLTNAPSGSQKRPHGDIANPSPAAAHSEQDVRERKAFLNRKRAERRKKQKYYKKLRAQEDVPMTQAEPEEDPVEAFTDAETGDPPQGNA